MANQADIRKAAVHFENFMLALGLDPYADEHLQDTPFRFAKHIAEQTKNYRKEPKLVCKAAYNPSKEIKLTTFDAKGINELVVMTNIAFSSQCAHHFAPFFGVAHIGYLPDEKMIGLSKLPRLLDFYALRPQTQELMTRQVCDKLREVTQARFVGVILQATHTCVSCRGVQKADALTTTSAFFDGATETRQEFLKIALG